MGRRQRIEQHAEALWSERAGGYDAHWRELADYLMPRRVRWFTSDRNRGDKRSQNIIDSTARFALRTLQSGLHAGLTSPARPWFSLSTFDPDLAERQNVKEWLHEVTTRMQAVFEKTNLYNVLPVIYGDMAGFGTAAMSVQDDEKDLFRCYPYPIGSYALGLDARGMVTTFYRKYELTVRQIVEMFGVQSGYRDIDWTNISQAVKAQWDQGNYQSGVEVGWVVMPNEEYSPNRLQARFKRWVSLHYETGASGDTFLRESGYDTFPVMAPRWDTTGEDSYGTSCPGMDALGDIKQLQLMQKEKAKAIQKSVNPPLVGPPELRTQKTSLLPGDITYAADRKDGGLRPIHEVGLNIDHLVRDIAETQYRIQRAFFEDLFLMLARSDSFRGSTQVTAREIEERHEEKLLALGPVLERTEDELLEPVIDRVFALMNERGMLPPWPSELDGVQLRVQYTSIMADAQRLVAVVGLDRFSGSIAPWAQAVPEVLDKINFDEMVDDYGRSLGLNPKIIRASEAAAARRAQRAQQQQAMIDAQQAQTIAKAAKDASGAQLNNDSMLDQIVRGAASPQGPYPSAA